MKFTIDEKEYTLSPVSMSVLSAAERHIRTNDTAIQDAIAATKDADDTTKTAILGAAFTHSRRIIGMDEVGTWLLSPGGLEFMFWQSLKVYHDGMPCDEAVAIYEKLSAEQLTTISKFLSESNELPEAK